jgi:transcription initiation factor TFIID subunit 1, fungi type
MNKSGHRYNVQEQQKVYAQEKERIWQAQMKSLSRKDPPELTDEEDEKAYKRIDSVADTPAADSVASPSATHTSLPQADSQNPGEKGGHKVLVLKREVAFQTLIMGCFSPLSRNLANHQDTK